ncbi:MAG: ABC transporter ATP-binding protein [Chromatiales bacterium]|nr:ABC transporter ATP-binding protein [Chromatiales bacterium]
MKPATLPLVKVKSARLAREGRRMLDGVDLELADGRLLALIGPNGAGKSTLLRVLAGRRRLDSGSVRVLGQDPLRQASARRAIGFVPQSIALYPQLPVRSNLEIFARLLGVPGRAIRQAVDEALDWSGLRDRAADAVSQLSGGMQRRVNIAAGTLHQPRLLLLDEPAVGLDPGVRGTIQDLMRRLRERGIGIVLTTHDLAEAGELADEVAIMLAGRIAAFGSPAELVAAEFGQCREVNLLLHVPPDDPARTALIAGGFLPTASARLWTTRFDGGLVELEQLRSRLSAQGLAVDELRLREPGLDGLFLRVTGEILQ